jgi:hypothetical protein
MNCIALHCIALHINYLTYHDVVFLLDWEGGEEGEGVKFDDIF